jgi:uncharacterized alpha-E superfamily protein
MLSRVARNVYWMSRYLERAENTARLVNVNGNLLLDLPQKTSFGWESLLAISGLEVLFYERYKIPNEQNVVKFLLSDHKNHSSILSSLETARENLRTTRDIIPREAWENVNDIHWFVKTETAKGISKRTRYEFLKYIILGIQQITGFLSGSMSHNMAYKFLSLGRYLERADMTTRILDVRSANLLPKMDKPDEPMLFPFENIQWVGVLKSLTAYQMYRQQTQMVRVKGASVLKFLLQDHEFPRTVCFCLDQIELYLKGLPGNDPPLRKLARLQRQIQTADVHALAHEGLHEFIDDLQIGMGELHGYIDTIYLGNEAEMKQTQTQTA